MKYLNSWCYICACRSGEGKGQIFAQHQHWYHLSHCGSNEENTAQTEGPQGLESWLVRSSLWLTFTFFLFHLVWSRLASWASDIIFSWYGKVPQLAFPPSLPVYPSTTIHWRGSANHAFATWRCFCTGGSQQPSSQFHICHTTWGFCRTAGKQHSCSRREGNHMQK